MAMPKTIVIAPSTKKMKGYMMLDCYIFLKVSLTHPTVVAFGVNLSQACRQ
jgi:hypothetical protein